jgi:starvation-inducible outer membrane lipoprotein
MLTKQQLDSLGLRAIGRDNQGRLVAEAAPLLEPLTINDDDTITRYAAGRSPGNR